VSDDASSPFNFRLDFPPELPISARAEEIVATIQAHQVVILAGETGSGKTTQIPKMCLAAGRGIRGKIACTQPRRVAALSISKRVADELNVDWGREVGCKIRFNDQTSNATVIKFLTDGMLLAEVQGDPMLRGYDTIILDEAHERSLNIDFLLGHLRLLRFKRPELKIIITSATIDTEAFSKAFDDAPVIQVSGRTYPVEVIYAPLDEFGSDAAEGDERESRSEALHYVDGAVEAVERIVRDSDSGDVLVFMPAERDIRETCELLDGRRLKNCELVPLFGRLSNAEQQRVFSGGQRRKIVVATNIAETSLTIPGIRFVVDTGLARLSRYSPQSRTRRLPIEEVSQSSADQRKGRSGRVAAGVCIRLYSEKNFNERPRFTQPEIQRANLADVILRMKAFGLGDIERFPFINMPAAKSIRSGYALLEELGAIGEEADSGAVVGGVPSPRAGEESGPGVMRGAATPPTTAAAASRQLTPIGRELARLPVDPTVGRMILQARTEKCLREVLVIASGLSIQDPRERPLDAREKADAAHRRFTHPDSDFLALLNIWEAFHDEFERLSQAKLRRFCRDHFLSYTRMREWRDIHAQLLDVLEGRDDFRMTSAFHGMQAHEITPDKEAFGTPAFRAIHRSILAGLLGNIATRDDENGGYKATHDRRVTLFPGSVLFAREEPKKFSPKGGERAPKKDNKSPRWIMAAEIMETSRLYARTSARLDPLWALDLGAHVTRVSHSEPFWNEEGGRVLVKQKTRLYGLEIESRSVSYGRIDPVHATEIFIREALVNDTITWPFDFLAHNRAVRENVESLLTRARDSSYMNLDEGVYRFYAARLMQKNSPVVGGVPSPREGRESGTGVMRGGGTPPTSDENRAISCVAELVALVRERKGAEPRFLMMESDDLRDPDQIAYDAEAFPESLPLENSALPIVYAYKPGQTDDGVTINVHVREAEALTERDLDWAVPGHLEAKVEHYLRATPKELRKAFMPLAETAKSVAAQLVSRDKLTGRRETLLEALAAQLGERFQLRLDPALWADKPLPDHLRVRVRVLDDEEREVCASRELSEIRTALVARQREVSVNVAREDPDAWRRARAKWEKPEQASWIFGDIPARVQIGDLAGVPVWAFPGLKSEGAGVALRLFKTAEEAAAATRGGYERLIELHLRYELAWLEKDLKKLRELGTLTSVVAPVEALQKDAFDSIRRWLCARPAGALTAAGFTAAGFTASVDLAKDAVRGLVPKFIDLVREILTLRQAVLVHPQPYGGLGPEVRALVPPEFLRVIPYAQLAHLPRYLKAMKLRADRWQQNRAKDAERVKLLAPYVAAVGQLATGGGGARSGGGVVSGTGVVRGGGTPPTSEAGQAFRWLVEEYRVSLFAQELGTAEPVSPVKLDRALAELRSGGGQGASVSAPGATGVGSLGMKSGEKAPAVAGRGESGPAAPVAAPLQVAPTKRSTPLKNLGGLDSLFRR
jgi:ATP-dependent helicase HrpA